MQALAECYRPGETYSSAFGKLMARIFAGTGLILLDPMSAELHRLAAPVYRAALEQHGELTKELVERGKALEQAGYHAQVKVADGNTLLFVDVDGERVPLRARDGGFVLGQRAVSPAEALKLLGEAPEAFSPNALLRPVVQDSLLPTAAYRGGSRGDCLLCAGVGRVSAVDRANARDHAARELYAGRAARGAASAQVWHRACRHLPRAGASAIEDGAGFAAGRTGAAVWRYGEKALRELLAGLREPISKLDATLVGALETAESKILYQFGNLAGKAAHAVAQRSSVLDAHERELMGLLYPRGELQERSLCFLPALAAQGLGLIEELVRRAAPGGAKHQVLYL